MSNNLTNHLIEQLEKAKSSARILSSIDTKTKNTILVSLVKILEEKKQAILFENQKDIAYATAIGKNDAFINRLSFTDSSFQAMLTQVQTVIDLDDPIGRIREERIASNGMVLKKINVPLGIIGIIYESRPNVTIDTAVLCIKSGNAVILKGGSESINTNRILVSCITEACMEGGVDDAIVQFIDTTDRETVSDLLKQHTYIDVLIPRGGYDLVKKVVEESTIPVLYHAEGGARIYIDESADIEKALAICVNAKINRPATCNSLDTVVVHERVADIFLKKLQEELGKSHVELRGDDATCAIIAANKAEAKDYETEFLDYILSIKIVASVDEAIAFIQKYTKGHSEGIVTDDQNVMQAFITAIDAAALFVNCSTRLHDGAEFGMGAEMGIATGKLHARGPVGLQELTTYKWIALGNGQIR